LETLPFFLDVGTGNALLLLHGNGEDHTYFSKQISVFSERYRVVAVDTRGHGQTPRGGAPFTLSQFAEDLKALLDALSIQRADLLGFTDGGNIALMFALRYPDCVRRLILAGANLTPTGMKTSLWFVVWRDYLHAGIASFFNPKWRHQRELSALMALQPHIPVRELRKLQTPTLVLAGTQDVIRERHTRRIASALPHATLLFLTGGHNLAQESPVLFNRTVLAFLSQGDIAESPQI